MPAILEDTGDSYIVADGQMARHVLKSSPEGIALSASQGGVPPGFNVDRAMAAGEAWQPPQTRPHLTGSPAVQAAPDESALTDTGRSILNGSYVPSTPSMPLIGSLSLPSVGSEHAPEMARRIQLDAPRLTGNTKPAAPPSPDSFIAPLGQQAQPAGSGAGPMAQVARMAMGSSGGQGFGAPGQSGIDRAAKQQADALKSMAEAGRHQAAAEAGFYDEQQQQMAQREARRQEMQDQHTAHMQEGFDRYQQLSDAATKTTETVDPNRFWAHMDTGNKILAGIGILLGGVGQGFTGDTTNKSMEIIQNAIHQDIQLQKDAIDRGKQDRTARAAGQLTLLGQMRQQFGDDIAANAAAEATANSIAALKLKQLQAQTSDPEIQAKTNLLIGQLNQNAEEKKQEFGIRWSQVGVQRQELALKQQEAFAKSQGGMNPELFVPGVGMALDKEAAKEARKISAGTQATLAPLGKLIEWRTKHGATVLDRSALAQGRIYAKQVQLGLKESGQLGTLDKGSQEFLDDMVDGNPGAIGFELPKLQALQGSVQDGYRARLTPYMDPRSSDVRSPDERLKSAFPSASPNR